MRGPLPMWRGVQCQAGLLRGRRAGQLVEASDLFVRHGTEKQTVTHWMPSWALKRKDSRTAHHFAHREGAQI
jgi:hypothetical protein